MQNIGIKYVEYFLLALHIASHEIAPKDKMSPMKT